MTKNNNEILLRVENLTKHFPIMRGIIIQRQVGAVQAVDKVSFIIRKGETLGSGGRKRLRQIHHRTHHRAALPSHLR